MRPITKAVAEKRKILVTGASGFVGGALLRELQNDGRFEVYGVIKRHREFDTDSQWGAAKIFRSDISDSGIIRISEELKQAEIVVHAAGLAHQFGRVEKDEFRRVNVLGTENVCRLAQKIGAEHFVLISSVAVYGDYGATEIDETFACEPSGFYAESKLESESLAREFCERNEIRLTILRLSTVVGEGDRGNTARLITLIDKGRFFWVGDGGNKKSLIYKRDAAKGILKALETTETERLEIYNLTGEAVSMREIVRAISSALSKKTPRLKIPEKILRGFFRAGQTGISIGFLKKLEKTLERWLSDDIFSGRKFYEKFRYKPETPVPEALKKQAEYYLNGKKDKKSE
ncbi:MAG TPA: NAD-dependent epimerase/dehydratase family protein [Pyrinomonadaceae bacterium]|jgi:nucleoside-diphosphate-sugar epimerase